MAKEIAVKLHSKAENRKRRRPLLPALIFTVILTQIPFLVTLVISTFHWNIIYPKDTKFVWFDNFKVVFTDLRMRAAIINSIKLTTMVVVASTLLGLLLAVLLDRKFKGRAIVRTLLITPFLITPVASALMWKHIIFNPLYGIMDGFATQIAQKFGHKGVVNIDFVSNQPLLAVAVPMIWMWTPFMTLMTLAALGSVPKAELEAAQVDRLPLHRLIAIVIWPHAKFILGLGILLRTIDAFKTMDLAYVMTGGGPGDRTELIAISLYRFAFKSFKLGYSTAVSVFLMFIAIALTSIYLYILNARKRAEE